MRLVHAVLFACQAIANASMHGEAWDAYVRRETCSAARHAGAPPGREPSGDGVLVGVDGVTPVQGARDSRVQGAGGQGTRHPHQGRHARCGAPHPLWASDAPVAADDDPGRIALDHSPPLRALATPTDVSPAMPGR